MALSAAQIQTIIDQLYSVLANRGGAAKVIFEGRTIEYDGVDAITKALKTWESKLARLSNTRPRVMRHNLGEFC